MSTTPKTWKYLVPNLRSSYKQLYVKDRWIAARTLYGQYMTEEGPRTPEQIAEDWDVPLEAVLESIAYCESNPPELLEDYARDEELMELSGMNDPNYKGQPKLLSPEDRARLNHL
jgi:hypothetical protein